MTPDPDYGVFAKSIETGSFSAAARALRLSPAMVSKRMVRLERRLGVLLIHRTTRRLSLTAAGEQFYEDVSSILGAIKQAEERLSGVQEVLGGPLRVSAPTSFGRLHIAPNVTSFLEENPGIELDLNLTDSFVNFTEDRTDVAIRITNTWPSSLTAEFLIANRRILCAAPRYIERFGLPGGLSELTKHWLLAAGEQSPWRLQGPQGVVEVQVASVVRTNSSEVVRELAIAGHGVALRSLWDISRELAEGRLIRVLPAFEGAADVGIYATYPNSPFVPAKVSRFVDNLRRLFQPTAPWEAPLAIPGGAARRARRN